MGYSYAEQKPFIFTDEGQQMFLKIRDKANKLYEIAGAFTIERVISGVSGDSWDMLACVDRLVELKEFKYVATVGLPAQRYVLVKTR